jgi:serine/threonine protein phosphatase 1
MNQGRGPAHPKFRDPTTMLTQWLDRLQRSRSPAPGFVPSLPPGLRIYAFGDIHGRADLLAHRLALVDEDIAARPAERTALVFLGDYIDRGSDSPGVIDLILARKEAGECIALSGNHEGLMLRALADESCFEDWRRNGGAQTIASYLGYDEAQLATYSQTVQRKALIHVMPPAHLAFFQGLPTHYQCGDYFFVHAGVRPGIDLERQRPLDMLWIREEFLNSKAQFGKFIVHGHTPTSQPDIRANRVNIDTMAYLTGNLTCLVLEGDQMEFLPTHPIAP